MVFCIVVPLSDGNEVAWGVASDVWEGSDLDGERVFTSDVPSYADFSSDIQHERLAKYIALSVEALQKPNS